MDIINLEDFQRMAHSVLPSDDFFRNPETGVITERDAANVFIGAKLGRRFVIESYIQSGQFGRGETVYIKV